MPLFSRFKRGSTETTPRNSYEAPPQESKHAASPMDAAKDGALGYVKLFLRPRTLAMLIVVYVILSVS